MAADNWELLMRLGMAERELAEARRRHFQEPLFAHIHGPTIAAKEQLIADLQAEVKAGQERCAHAPNPEKPKRCYKCGLEPFPVARPAEPPAEAGKPPLAKTKRRSPLHVEIKKVVG